MEDQLSARFGKLGILQIHNKDAKYVYDTLDAAKKEIRLINIRPAKNPSKPIECTLSTYPLQEAPKYAALSYCWGDDKTDLYILLSGRQFPVTRNLFSALRQFREPKQGYIMWVDAICINQNDLEEKNSQIPLMREIYSQATWVPAWLGEESEDSNRAFDLIKNLSTAMLVLAEMRPCDLPDHEQVDLSTCWYAVEDHLDPRSWTAVRKLFDRPYWRRMWVVQEVTLSQMPLFCCGSQQMYLDHLLLLFDFVTVLVPDSQNDQLFTPDQKCFIYECGVRVITPFRPVLWESEDFNYVNLILLTGPQECKDPRDKLYALEGLADLHRGPDRFKVVPDYCLPPTVVFTDFVIGLVKSTRRLDILSMAGISRHTDGFAKKIPSWVVDFSDTRASVCGNGTGTRLSAAENLEAECSFSDDSTCLFIYGVIPDMIVRSLKFPDYAEGFSLRAFLADLCGRSQGNYSHPTGLPLLQIMFRTFILDSSGYGYGNVSFADREEEDDFLKKSVQFLFNLTLHQRSRVLTDAHATDSQTELEYYIAAFEEFSGPKDLEQRLPWDVQFFYKHAAASMLLHLTLYENVQDRSIFVTKKGYIGIGMLEVMAGDEICVLPGCNVPLILRKTENSHQMVGDSYVYGMMKGEMIQEVRDGRLRFENLRIQ